MLSSISLSSLPSLPFLPKAALLPFHIQLIPVYLSCPPTYAGCRGRCTAEHPVNPKVSLCLLP